MITAFSGVHSFYPTPRPTLTMITIEWASSLRRDGTRRKPPPSTIHGWLAKWRGTFLGDERLRSMGMREMREARDRRRYWAAKKRQTSAVSSGKSVFSFFDVQRKKPARISGRTTRPRTSARSGGGTARAKQVDGATHAQDPARLKGHKPSRVGHKPNLKTPASRPHTIPRKRAVR